MSGKLISRYCQRFRVRVDDYRLAFGTPAMKAAVLRQIEKRSRAAKIGWAKRRLALAAATREGGDAKQAPCGASQSGPKGNAHPQPDISS